MANQPVLTGALAIVKYKGTTVGLMKSISATENLTRGDVQGLGTILTSEAPVTQWRGSLTCAFYEFDFSQSGLTPDAIKRILQTSQEFEDQLVLNPDGIQVEIYKKVEDAIDPVTQLIKSKLTPFAVIKRILIESDSFDIAEGQVSGRNSSFRYLDPIIYPS